MTAAAIQVLQTFYMCLLYTWNAVSLNETANKLAHFKSSSTVGRNVSETRNSFAHDLEYPIHLIK